VNTAANYVPQAQDALNKINAGGDVSFGVGGGSTPKAIDYTTELATATKQLATDQETLNKLATDYSNIHILLPQRLQTTATATAAVVQQTTDLSRSTDGARESIHSASDQLVSLTGSGSQAAETMSGTHDAAVALSSSTHDLGNETDHATQTMGGLGGVTTGVSWNLNQFAGYVTQATANANALSSATSGLSESIAKVGTSAQSSGDWVDAYLNYKNAPKNVTRDQVNTEGAASDAAGGAAQQANLQAQAAVTAAQTATAAYQDLVNRHLAGDQTITASALASAKTQSESATATANAQVQAASTAQNAYDTLYTKASTDAAALVTNAQHGVTTAASTVQSNIQSSQTGKPDATQLGNAVGAAIMSGDNAYAMSLLMIDPTQISQVASVASAYITDHVTEGSTDLINANTTLSGDITTVGNAVQPWYASVDPNASAVASANYAAGKATGKSPIDVNYLGVQAANQIAAGNLSGAVADIIAGGDQGDAVISVMMSTIDSYIKHGQIAATNAVNATHLGEAAAQQAGNQSNQAAQMTAQQTAAMQAQWQQTSGNANFPGSPYSGGGLGGQAAPNTTGSNTSYTGYAGGFESLKSFDINQSPWADALSQALRNNAAATAANTAALNGNRPHSRVAVSATQSVDVDSFAYNAAAPGSLN